MNITKFRGFLALRADRWTATLVCSSLLFLAFAVVLCPRAAAQNEDDPPADVAPPPMRTLSPDEKKALDSENGIKKRTQLSLEFMDARIAKSEKLLVDNNFKDSLEELGRFQGLLDNALGFLVRNDDGGNKVDNNFKALEMYLRKQVPRLETIRREMPFKYSFYVQRLMKAVRDARARALDPLFKDSVVHDNKP